MSCTCCGEVKSTVALRSREDVELCRDCLEWLLGRIGISSTPTLPVRDMREAIDFYQAAGFGVRAYDDDNDADPGFAFVDYDGQSVFDLDGVPDLDPSANHAGCYLVVDNVDAWYARIARAGVPTTEIADQLWGMREFAFDDPSGNHVRIGHSSTGND